MTHNMSFLCSDAFPPTSSIDNLNSRYIAWTACVKTPEKLVPHLISQLKQIDFDQVEQDFQRTKITPKAEDWSEFLRWLYRHDRQNQWFGRVDDVGFVGK
jgi:hypothetical protein